MPTKSLDICVYCDAPTWCRPTGKGPQCEACRVVKFFKFGLFAPLGFRLLNWQRETLRGIYGPHHVETGARTIRRAYVEVPKKQGKSFLIAGLPLYHLVNDEPDEHPEIYGCAAAKDQAGIVYRSALRLMQGNQMLTERLKPLPSTKRILRKDGAGFYAVLSADGDVQDGIEPSLGIIDELHRWKTAKAQTLYDVLTRGTISRKEPLVVEITTAGDVYDSPICWSEHEYARQMLNGSLKSDRFFAAIWAADEQKLKDDPEYWKSRQFRVDANPSHEDHGGFLKDSELEALCKEAQDKPAEQARYLRYHGNVWGQRSERWMPMDAWKRCGILKQPSLVNRECWAGVDLSQTTDLTSLVLVFPDGEYLDVMSFFWLPKDNLKRVQKHVHVDLEAWSRTIGPFGFNLLETTEGKVVDYGAVRKRLDWARETFQLQEVCYDPFNASNFFEGEGGLIEQGYRCIKYDQRPPILSPAMKWLMEKVLSEKLRHADHPVLTWNADCVSVRTDYQGRICPDKEKLQKDGKRIDGISALVTALARVMIVHSEQSAWGSEKITF